MKRTKVSKAGFLIDGKPFRILSGAIHYFRTVPEQWEDRLRKLQLMGLNCVETYVAWNMHEPRPGKFEFTGMADIEQFIALAGGMGLKVIVRPGPYICSEWDFGGLPGWLSVLPDMRLRCNNAAFLDAVGRFFAELLPRLERYSHVNGGPIIALQVENEYGSYGTDKAYLTALKNILEQQMPKLALFTSDGALDYMLQGGMIEGVWETVNFGSGTSCQREKLREYQPDLPFMCGEFWNGWFDHWGEEHHVRDAADAAQSLDEILQNDGQVNIYMFHGGTNFGFMNGANRPEIRDYQPTVTSYDSDAPLNECGDITPKYLAHRKVLAKYNAAVDLAAPLPSPCLKKAYGVVELGKRAGLFDNLGNISRCHMAPLPLCMERLGQNYGFILYRRRLRGPYLDVTLTVQEPRDRAQIFLDGRQIAIMHVNDKEHSVKITVPETGAMLEILVENLGRVNYGAFLEDSFKGITTGVRIEQQFLHDWEIYPLPLDDLAGLEYGDSQLDGLPAFYKAEFEVDAPADTWLKVQGTKGCCWINGFNIGRYWDVGPERNLYVPAPLLKTGKNVLTIFELHELKQQVVEFVEKP
ncbi:MAG: beta-galactosidase family protein [Bacillota bacterium]